MYQLKYISKANKYEFLHLRHIINSILQQCWSQDLLRPFFGSLSLGLGHVGNGYWSQSQPHWSCNLNLKNNSKSTSQRMMILTVVERLNAMTSLSMAGLSLGLGHVSLGLSPARFVLSLSLSTASFGLGLSLS
jgi:hypothetical protein